MSPVSEEIAVNAKNNEGEHAFVYGDSTCRGAAERMASEGMANLRVVDRGTGLVQGMITVHDLLKGRGRAATRENEKSRLATERKAPV
jgi:CBS domain-containing protein